MFEYQLDSWIQGVVSDDRPIVASQEHTSDDIFVALFKAELTQGQFGLHFFSCFVEHDSGERLLASTENGLDNLSVLSSDFNGNVFLHHSEHTLNKLDGLLGQ